VNKLVINCPTKECSGTSIPRLRRTFGGAWERLVQSAKRALKAVVGKQRVNDETLLTFMAEVESLMNGRPLTHVRTDYRDEEALTPNHFPVGRGTLMSRQMSSRTWTCSAERGESTRKL